MPVAAYASLPIHQILLDRMAAGEVLGGVCREPAMPNYVTVWNWRRRNPAFDAACREAQRRGRERRRFRFDEARAEEVLARLRNGEKIMQILARRGSPVGLRLYRHWMMTQAPFHAEVRRLLAQNRRRTGSPTRAFDPALADLMVARVAAGARIGDLGPAMGFPGRAVTDRWRRSRPEFDRALRIATKVRRRRAASRAASSDEVLEPVLDLVRQGASLRQAAGRPGMPKLATLYRWRRDYPDVAAALARAKTEQADWLSDRLWALTQGGRPAPADRAEVRRLRARLRRLEATPKPAHSRAGGNPS